MSPSGWFWFTYVPCLCLGLLCLLFVVFWTSHWHGGFAWDGSGLQFNWHPVLMVTGLVVLYGFGRQRHRGDESFGGCSLVLLFTSDFNTTFKGAARCLKCLRLEQNDLYDVIGVTSD